MITKQKLKKQIGRVIKKSDIGKKIILKRRLGRLMKTTLPKYLMESIENGSKSQNEAVDYCYKQFPESVKRIQTWIDRLFDRAPFFVEMDNIQKEKIRTDILFCTFAYGFEPDEYLTYRLDQKCPDERRSFISEREHIQYYSLMNDLYEIDIFNDKMKTYSFYKEYYGREIVAIEKNQDFTEFQKFVKKHPAFVKKEVNKSCGRSIEKLVLTTYEEHEKDLFLDLISRGKTVLEECVVQHPVTAVFNSSSVNTVRVITFNTKHGIVAPYTFMKIGRAGSFVDNGGAGGILVGIDEKTGMLNSRGIDELHREYEVHPDSGTPFYGHQLPDWDKAIAMCKEMAAKMPKVRYIGWDLAYTKDNKWVVIEGNGMSQFIGPQTIWQRGIKEEVLALMNDMDLVV